MISQVADKDMIEQAYNAGVEFLSISLSTSSR